MPIIAHAIINLNIDETGLVEILREQISKCGCINILTESKRSGVPIERIQTSLQSMSGVTCNDTKCCITDVSKFSAGMKKISGGE